MNGLQKFCWSFVGLLVMGLAMNARAQTTIEYVHTDALGSPVAVTNAAGAVIERTDYEPYGSAIGKPNYSGIGFTGHVQDGETGLTYMQQRYYDPMLGRFLSVDPVTAYDKPLTNFNRYAYASNNPYKFTDPDGRENREFNFENRQLGITPPPRAKGDWLGPAIGGALAVVMAPAIALVGWETGMAALANPATTTAIVSGVGEAAGVTGTAGGASLVAKEIQLSRAGHGEAAAHVADAIAAGKPSVLTIARDGAAANRNASIGSLAKVPGKHLDEYPPAMFKEGGGGASVRAISPRDNMSAGACIGNACRGLQNGEKVRITVGD